MHISDGYDPGVGRQEPLRGVKPKLHVRGWQVLLVALMLFGVWMLLNGSPMPTT
ncbi:MAG: hypothetical protein JO247_05355 [Chloroflexi bacterium]|nr:hypothetical protein [Chloroflexota bacterium]